MAAMLKLINGNIKKALSLKEGAFLISGTLQKNDSGCYRLVSTH